MPQYSYEWLCRQIVENSADAIVFADHAGLVRFWNGAAEAMFGYCAAEMLGKSLDMIIPENLQARHTEGYLRVMAAGISKYTKEVLAVPARRKDGARISLEFTLALIREPAGEILGAAAIIREVTARWEKEKEMRRLLAALKKDSG